jgi:hypothetical protein
MMHPHDMMIDVNNNSEIRQLQQQLAKAKKKKHAQQKQSFDQLAAAAVITLHYCPSPHWYDASLVNV